MSTVLKKITTRAKQIYKKGKAGISWVAAIKRASVQIKSAGPKRKRSRAVKRRRRIGGIIRNPKLLSASFGKGPTITDTRKMVTAPTVSGIGRVTRRKAARKPAKSVAVRYKAEVKTKLANALLAHDLAKTVKATKKAQKQKIKFRRLLRVL